MDKNLQIAAVILAGGRATRLGGVDKGLQPLGDKPLVSHILERLSPQIGEIWLNINRSFADYQRLYPSLPHYADDLADFQGALSGMLSGFAQIPAEQLLFVPCDSPFLPDNLRQKLAIALRINQAQIAYVHDGDRPHPTFALLDRSVVPALQAYLDRGERRLLHFFQTQKSVAVDFSDQSEAFRNLNTVEEFVQINSPLTTFGDFPRKPGQNETASGHLPSKICKTPLLAITGYSGTGKTTLLENLIPELTRRNIKVGLIKHSHHNVEVDKAGKDSHRLRLAGANPTMIVCDQRWALMCETDEPATFAALAEKMVAEKVDLILVEGFKHEGLPKIQLHRKAVEKPLPELDEFTVATATDYPLERENVLDINNIEQIAEFIIGYLAHQ